MKPNQYASVRKNDLISIELRKQLYWSLLVQYCDMCMLIYLRVLHIHIVIRIRPHTCYGCHYHFVRINCCMRLHTLTIVQQ